MDNGLFVEEVVLQMLKERGLHVTFVESCTGGMLASKLICVSGASGVIEQSVVTYSNRAKQKLAGVKKSTLDKYGAVSRQTAMEMAQGGAKNAECEVCLSVTGVAGPSMEEGKPVGLVYIGLFYCETVSVIECHFEGSRQMIREAAVKRAFEFLIEKMSET